MEGPESRLTSKLIKLLKEYGGEWIKIHGGMYQVGGLPDIIGCLTGQFYAFEVKTPDAYVKSGHNLSPRQKLMLEKLEKAGARVGVVCSKEQVQEMMSKWIDQDYKIGGDK